MLNRFMSKAVTFVPNLSPRNGDLHLEMQALIRPCALHITYSIKKLR